MTAILNWPRQVVLKLIQGYQLTLSPDHSWIRCYHPYGFCRFYPTCSEYTYISVGKYGVAKGLWLGAQRLLKCHPYHRGGLDLVK